MLAELVCRAPDAPTNSRDELSSFRNSSLVSLVCILFSLASCVFVLFRVLLKFTSVKLD